MNLEKLFELVLQNPDNISISYTNINGDEKLIVNGKDLSESEPTFDDTKIKEKVSKYKAAVAELSDEVFDRVVEEAEKHQLNLNEMNKGLELESYTEEDALYAEQVIKVMSELIHEVLVQIIQEQAELLERFEYEY